MYISVTSGQNMTINKMQHRKEQAWDGSGEVLAQLWEQFYQTTKTSLRLKLNSWL